MMQEKETPFSVAVETTIKERLAVRRAGVRYARIDAGLKRPGKGFLYGACLGICAFAFFFIADRFRLDAWVQGLAVLWLCIGYIFFLQRKLESRVASAVAASYQVTLSHTGITIDANTLSSFVAWSEIRAIETRKDAVVIVLKNYSSLCMPNRCFADAPQADSFIAEIRNATGLTPENQRVPNVHAPVAGRFPLASIRALLSNVWAGVLLMLFVRKGSEFVRASVTQFVLLLGLGLLIHFGVDVSRIGLDGEFNWHALPYLLWGVPGFLLCAWVAAYPSETEGEAKLPGRVMACAVSLLAMSLFAYEVQQLLTLLPSSVWKWNYARMLYRWGPSVWLVLAAGWALTYIGQAAGNRKALLQLAVWCCLLIIPSLVNSGPYGSLWHERYDDSAYEAEQKHAELAAKEEVLYAQPELLANALSKLEPGRPGVPELYLVALAGYGSQDVFLRETDSVMALFAQRFDTAGRSVELVNNPSTVLKMPIASMTALERTLKTVGERMNRDEDVLFLFMTSHGAKESFSLELWPYQFEDMTPERLRKALDVSGIKNRVLVVSACYSGGFIKPLEDDNTLVMTASRADRNSHGCSHEADWTFFGRAYFDEALRHTRSFTQAFEEARESVASREKAEDLTPSEPQIFVGKNIGLVLQRVQERLDAGTQK